MWFDQRMSFFYAERNEYVQKRTDYGIIWSRMPAFVVLTPKGNYFPIGMDVRLGDEKTIDNMINEHLLNFTKGILPMPDRQESVELQNRDYEIYEKLGNTR